LRFSSCHHFVEPSGVPYSKAYVNISRQAVLSAGFLSKERNSLHIRLDAVSASGV